MILQMLRWAWVKKVGNHGVRVFEFIKNCCESGYVFKNNNCIVNSNFGLHQV